MTYLPVLQFKVSCKGEKNQKAEKLFEVYVIVYKDIILGFNKF